MRIFVKWCKWRNLHAFSHLYIHFSVVFPSSVLSLSLSSMHWIQKINENDCVFGSLILGAFAISCICFSFLIIFFSVRACCFRYFLLHFHHFGVDYFRWYCCCSSSRYWCVSGQCEFVYFCCCYFFSVVSFRVWSACFFVHSFRQ